MKGRDKRRKGRKGKGRRGPPIEISGYATGMGLSASKTRTFFIKSAGEEPTKCRPALYEQICYTLPVLI